jgi:hypothetical protein
LRRQTKRHCVIVVDDYPLVEVLLESSPQRGTRVTVSIPTVIQISENDLILKRDPTLKKEEGDNHEQNIANA